MVDLGLGEDEQLSSCQPARIDPALVLGGLGGDSTSPRDGGLCDSCLAEALFSFLSISSSASICSVLHSSLQNAMSPLLKQNMPWQ